MLCRALDQHITCFARQGQGGLTLQIEVLLPADFQLAGEPVDSSAKRGVRIAFGVDARSVLKAAVGGEGLINGQKWRLGRDVDLAQSCCRAGGEVAGGNHQKQGLAYIMHGPNSKQRLIVVGRGDIVGKRQIISSQDGDNAHRCADRSQIHGCHRAARDKAGPEGQMQRACGRGNVIDIARRAGHMQPRGIMGQGLGNAHARTSCRSVCLPVRVL